MIVHPLDQIHTVIEFSRACIVGIHRERVTVEGDILINLRSRAETVEAIVKLHPIKLRRAVTHGVDGRNALAPFPLRHARIGMFVSLQHQVHIFIQQTSKFPALEQIVRFRFDGIDGMVQHHHLPARCALCEFFAQPRGLFRQVGPLSIGVEQKQLHISIAEGVHLIFAFHRFEEIRKHQ